jgi:peptide deformylase
MKRCTMLLKLYQTGQPVLRSPAKPVTKHQLSSQHVQTVIDFMISTLRDAPGVGLAAPQVGEALQIVIIEDKVSYHETVPKNLLYEQNRKPISLKVLINPSLEIIDPEAALYFEGCLSIEGYVGVIPRVKAVKVTALDRNGNSISYIAKGWHARIVQHEVDHLLGKLYIDNMIPQSFISIKNFSLLWRKSLEKNIKDTFVVSSVK